MLQRHQLMVDGRDSVHTAHAPKPAGEVLRRGQGRVQTPPLSGEETTVPDLLRHHRLATPTVAQVRWFTFYVFFFMSLSIRKDHYK